MGKREPIWFGNGPWFSMGFQQCSQPGIKIGKYAFILKDSEHSPLLRHRIIIMKIMNLHMLYVQILNIIIKKSATYLENLFREIWKIIRNKWITCRTEGKFLKTSSERNITTCDLLNGTRMNRANNQMISESCFLSGKRRWKYQWWSYCLIHSANCNTDAHLANCSHHKTCSGF